MSAVDERVSVTFASDGNSPTRWIEVLFPVDNAPDELFDELASIGFVQDSSMVPDPPMMASVYDESRPVGDRFVDLGYMEQKFQLFKLGTDLFGGWTRDEQRANMRQARAVMRKFGFTKVPVWKKTFADMM